VQPKVSLIAGSLGLAAATACVTINIYFPAAAAERVADRIIEDVYQLKPDAAKPDAAKPGGGEASKPK
jgi:hypothetical protein